MVEKWSAPTREEQFKCYVPTYRRVVEKTIIWYHPHPLLTWHSEHTYHISKIFRVPLQTLIRSTGGLGPSIHFIFIQHTFPGVERPLRDLSSELLLSDFGNPTWQTACASVDWNIRKLVRKSGNLSFDHRDSTTILRIM